MLARASHSLLRVPSGSVARAKRPDGRHGTQVDTRPLCTDPRSVQRVVVHVGDITRVQVDAVVNAANERLLGGGGVDGAIHRAAGPQLLEACRLIPEVRPGVRCPTGEARLTPGFLLPARWVVHTVGPVWYGGARGEERLLRSCYESSLSLAVEEGARSVAFPAISCGVFGYPKRAAAQVAVGEIERFLASDSTLERVLLVAFDEGLGDTLRRALESARV